MDTDVMLVIFGGLVAAIPTLASVVIQHFFSERGAKQRRKEQLEDATRQRREILLDDEVKPILEFIDEAVGFGGMTFRGHAKVMSALEAAKQFPSINLEKWDSSVLSELEEFYDRIFELSMRARVRASALPPEVAQGVNRFAFTIAEIRQLLHHQYGAAKGYESENIEMDALISSMEQLILVGGQTRKLIRDYRGDEKKS